MTTKQSNTSSSIDKELQLIEFIKKIEDSSKKNGQTFWDLLHKISTYYNYINRLSISTIFITILVTLLSTHKFKFFFDVTKSDLKLDYKEIFFIQMFWITIIPFMIVQCVKDINKWLNNKNANQICSNKSVEFYRELLSYAPKDTKDLIEELLKYINNPDSVTHYSGETTNFKYFFINKKLTLFPSSLEFIDNKNPITLANLIRSYPEYIFIKELFGLNRNNPFEFSFEDDNLISAMNKEITFKSEQIKSIDVIIKELRKKHKIR